MPHASDIQKQDSTPSAANILTANGNGVSISNSGNSCFSVGQSQILLNDILHVPAIKKKLLSVKKLCDDNNFSVTFDSSNVSVKDRKTNEVVLTGGVAGGLYQLHITNTKVPSINLGIKAPLAIWHARLGHCNERITRKLVADFSLPVSSRCVKKCDSCIVRKTHQSSYPSSINKESLMPLDLLFTDVWGPAPMTFAFGTRFYVLFVDKSTRYNWIFPIERKSQVKETFIKFKNRVELQFDRKICVVQSDNGDEFLALKQFFQTTTYLTSGHVLMSSYPQQMGTVERCHRHIVDIVITLLHHAKLPLDFWYFAFTTSAFLYNRVPMESLAGKSPFQMLFGEAPNLIGLKIFGSWVFPNLRPYRQHIFAPRSEEHVFLGYPHEHAGYICFNPKNGKIIFYLNLYNKKNESKFKW